MTINKHGYTIKNLRKVSAKTIDNSRGYSQISYDTVTGELLEEWHVGNPLTSWTIYHNPTIINIANTNRHMTMQQLADAVHQAMEEYQARKDFEKLVEKQYGQQQFKKD